MFDLFRVLMQRGMPFVISSYTLNSQVKQALHPLQLTDDILKSSQKSFIKLSSPVEFYSLQGSVHHSGQYKYNTNRTRTPNDNWLFVLCGNLRLDMKYPIHTPLVKEQNILHPNDKNKN